MESPLMESPPFFKEETANLLKAMELSIRKIFENEGGRIAMGAVLDVCNSVINPELYIDAAAHEGTDTPVQGSKSTPQGAQADDGGPHSARVASKGVQGSGKKVAYSSDVEMRVAEGSDSEDPFNSGRVDGSRRYQYKGYAGLQTPTPKAAKKQGSSLKATPKRMIPKPVAMDTDDEDGNGGGGGDTRKDVFQPPYRAGARSGSEVKDGGREVGEKRKRRSFLPM